jgi:hypothetical protein
MTESKKYPGGHKSPAPCGARFLIRENPNCTILPLDSRNQESVEPGICTDSWFLESNGKMVQLGFSLITYSYCQRNTHIWLWVVGSVTLVARKNRKEKKNSLFVFRAKPVFLSSRQLFCKYTCTRTYFVFLLCTTLKEGTYLHCQECGSRLSKRLSSKGISLQARTQFHWWQ